MKGYLLTGVGAVFGGAAGLVGGTFLGFAVVPDGSGFEELEEVFITAFVGCWIGLLVGAYLALKAGGCSRESHTVRWLALLAPVLVGGGAWLAVSMTDADDFGSNFLPFLIFCGAVVACVWGARRLGTGVDARSGRPGAGTT